MVKQANRISGGRRPAVDRRDRLAQPLHRASGRPGNRRVAAGLLLVLTALALPGCGERVIARLDYNPDNARKIRREFEWGGGATGGPSGGLVADENRQPQWATLKGVVRVDDPSRVPPPNPLRITKDQNICAPGGKTVFDEQVVLGPGGAVQNVLIFLNTPLPKNDADADQPLWVHSSYSYAAHPELAEIVFDQQQCTFVPHVIAARSDQRIKILNSDPVLHNTKTSPRNAVPINISIAAHDFFYYEPKRQEDTPFAVACSVHPWMSAWMITRDNPYFAVTGKDGSFEIANIPAGVELEWRIWHEKSKFINDTVKINGQDVRLKKGRFPLKLEPGETRTLELVINAAVFQ